MTGQPNRTVREKKMALFFCNHFFSCKSALIFAVAADRRFMKKQSREPMFLYKRYINKCII